MAAFKFQEKPDDVTGICTGWFSGSVCLRGFKTIFIMRGRRWQNLFLGKEAGAGLD
jgi:hypothetical protein